MISRFVALTAAALLSSTAWAQLERNFGTDTQRFTASGTWTKPYGAKTVRVVCTGGG